MRVREVQPTHSERGAPSPPGKSDSRVPAKSPYQPLSQFQRSPKPRQSRLHRDQTSRGAPRGAAPRTRVRSFSPSPRPRYSAPKSRWSAASAQLCAAGPVPGRPRPASSPRPLGGAGDLATYWGCAGGRAEKAAMGWRLERVGGPRLGEAGAAAAASLVPRTGAPAGSAEQKAGWARGRHSV